MSGSALCTMRQTKRRMVAPPQWGENGGKSKDGGAAGSQDNETGTGTYALGLQHVFAVLTQRCSKRPISMDWEHHRITNTRQHGCTWASVVA